jgi:hypothetical protein
VCVIGLGGWLAEQSVGCLAGLRAHAFDGFTVTTNKNWNGQGESDGLIKT